MAAFQCALPSTEDPELGIFIISPWGDRGAEVLEMNPQK